MKKHFILTLGRSGSNAIVELINQHPQALNYGELLGDWNTIRKWQRRLGWKRMSDAAYLDALLRDGPALRAINGLRSARKVAARRREESRSISRLRTIGAKDFATFFTTAAMRDYFRKRPDIRVVGLQRDDVIARFMSWQLLDQTGTVKRQTGEARQTHSIRLDPTTLTQKIEAVARENAHLEEMLSELPEEQVFRVRYEDFFFDTDVIEAETQRMFAFLGLETTPVALRARKINTAFPSKVISNYEECMHALAGTGHEKLFEQAG